MNPARSGPAVVAALVLATTGCQGDPEASAPSSSSSRAGSAATPGASTCIAAELDGTSVQLTVPEGFSDASEEQLLQHYWTRSPADGEGSFDVVALDPVDSEASDADVISRAMTGTTGGDDDGAPDFERAQREAGEPGTTQVEWTAPERVGDGRHRGLVRLETVDGVRFTVSLLASPSEYAGLRSAVLDSVRPGECS